MYPISPEFNCRALESAAGELFVPGEVFVEAVGWRRERHRGANG
jgi:hypothetical protein